MITLLALFLTLLSSNVVGSQDTVATCIKRFPMAPASKGLLLKMIISPGSERWAVRRLLGPPSMLTGNLHGQLEYYSDCGLYVGYNSGRTVEYVTVEEWDASILFPVVIDNP